MEFELKETSQITKSTNLSFKEILDLPDEKDGNRFSCEHKIGNMKIIVKFSYIRKKILLVENDVHTIGVWYTSDHVPSEIIVKQVNEMIRETWKGQKKEYYYHTFAKELE